MFRLLWLLVCTSSVLYGQVLTTDVVTRALGGTGLAQEGGAAVWTNPAGLAYTTRPTGRATVEQRFGLRELQTASLAGSLPGGIGVRLAHFGYSGFTATTVDGLYARSLTGRLAVGIALGVHLIEPPQQEAIRGLRTGLGAQYRLTEQLRLGVVWQSDGINAAQSGLGAGLSYRLSELTELSAELHYAAQGALSGRVGIAYAPVEVVALRLGLHTAGNELSGGVGYRLAQRWEVAITATYHQQLGLSPVAGIIFQPE